MAPQKNTLELPVVGNPAQFDAASGNRLERLVFNYRAIVLLLCALMTLVLGWEATRLPVNANFERMIPQRSPYIRNYLQYKNELPGLGNTIRVVVENKRGDISVVYTGDPDEILAAGQLEAGRLSLAVGSL